MTQKTSGGWGNYGRTNGGSRVMLEHQGMLWKDEMLNRMGFYFNPNHGLPPYLPKCSHHLSLSCIFCSFLNASKNFLWLWFIVICLTLSEPWEASTRTSSVSWWFVAYLEPYPQHIASSHHKSDFFLEQCSEKFRKVQTSSLTVLTEALDEKTLFVWVGIDSVFWELEDLLSFSHRVLFICSYIHLFTQHSLCLSIWKCAGSSTTVISMFS